MVKKTTKANLQQKQNINKNIYNRVAVLCGGNSAEREVSLDSGRMVHEALVSAGINSVLVDLKDDPINQIVKINPSHAFIALHGTGGEDGEIQGFLECLKIPYTGSGLAAASLAMDKYRTKLVWQACNLPTPPYIVVDDSTSEKLKTLDFNKGFFVKPSCEGSSIGIAKVTDQEGLADAVAKASHFHGKILIEEMIVGSEFTVGILNGKALPVVHLEAVDHSFYDYDAKYKSPLTQFHIPSGLSSEKELELQQLALDAFNVIGCEGWGRVDTMQDAKGKFWLLEVNTVPGLTSHSLLPMAAKHAGYDFLELVVALLKTSDVRFNFWGAGHSSRQDMVV